MALWETLKGAIEGFEKEGIGVGVSVAIKGFFNSIIFGPLKILKETTALSLDVF